MNILQLLQKKYGNIRGGVFSIKSSDDLEKQYSKFIWNDLDTPNANPVIKPSWDDLSVDIELAPYIENQWLDRRKSEIWVKVKNQYDIILEKATVNYNERIYQGDPKSIMFLSAAVCNGDQIRKWLDIDNSISTLTQSQLKQLISKINDMTEFNFSKKELLRSTINSATNIEELDAVKELIQTGWAPNPY